MSERIDSVTLIDIRQAVDRIEEYVSNLSESDFLNDGKTIDAVYMNLIVIGEAANRLSEEFKDAHPTIDWFKIRGLRNRIAHEYKAMDIELIYKIVQTQIKELKAYLEKIL